MARVFVSYSRKTSADAADRVEQALRGSAKVFLDRSSLDDGVPFPRDIARAILDADCFLALFDDAYAASWYCVRELRIALTAWNRARERRSAVAPVILFGLRNATEAVLAVLPPDLRTRNWRSVDDPKAIAEAVRKLTAEEGATTFGTWIAEDDQVVLALTEGSRLPEPRTPAKSFPTGLLASIEERFHGRADELTSIHTYLEILPRVASRSAAVVLLEGFAGVGKTRLATEYVHRFGTYFPGGVYWLDAGISEASFERQLRELLRTMSDCGADEIRKDPRRALTAWISRQSQPMLFVTDGIPVNDPAPLDRWCPAQGRASVLATTRVRRSAWAAHVRAVPVLPLSDAAAAAMLKTDVDVPIDERDSWKAIANSVGGLPLALELLNTGIRIGAWSAEALEALIARNGAVGALDGTFAALVGQVPAGSTLRNVAAVFEASFRALSPDARRAADRLAVLASAPIPADVAERLIAGRTRAELVNHSIVLPAPRESVDVFGRLHALYAEYLQRRGTGPRWFQRVEQWLPMKLQPKRMRLRHSVYATAGALASTLQKRREWEMLLAVAPHVETTFAFGTNVPLFGDVLWSTLANAYGSAVLQFAATRPTHADAFESVRSAVGGGGEQDPFLLGALTVADRLDALETPKPPRELELLFLGRRDPTGSTPSRGIPPNLPPEFRRVLQESRSRVEEVYRIRAAVSGLDDLGTLSVAVDAALSSYASGDIEALSSWYRVIFEGCRCRYGDRAPNTMVALWHMLVFAISFDDELLQLRDKHLRWLMRQRPGQLTPPVQDVRAGLLMFRDIKPRDFSPPLDAASRAKAEALRGFRAQYLAEDPKRSRAHLDRAIAGGVRNHGVFAARADAALESGDVEGALRHLDRAEKEGMPAARVHSARARVLLRGEYVDAAREEISRAIEAGSDDPEDYMLRATMHRLFGDPKVAEADLRKAMKLGVTSPGLRVELARTLRLQERYDEALLILNAVAKAHPEYAPALKERREILSLRRG